VQDGAERQMQHRRDKPKVQTQANHFGPGRRVQLRHVGPRQEGVREEHEVHVGQPGGERHGALRLGNEFGRKAQELEAF